jgi:hypothetical protein
VRYLPEKDGDVAAPAADAVRTAMARHLAVLAAINGDAKSVLGALDARGLSYAVAQHSSLPLADRQRLLECPDTAHRLAVAGALLRRENLLLSRLRAVPATAATFPAALRST